MQQKFDEVIGVLQTMRNEIAQYVDLSDKNRRAIFALAETNEQLSAAKRELAQATKSRDAAMLENERRHNEALVELQAKLHWLNNEISKAEAQLQEVEAKIPRRQAEYESYVRGIAALKRQLEVAA